jgi:hypothetical protein
LWYCFESNHLKIFSFPLKSPVDFLGIQRQQCTWIFIQMYTPILYFVQKILNQIVCVTFLTGFSCTWHLDLTSCNVNLSWDFQYITLFGWHVASMCSMRSSLVWVLCTCMCLYVTKMFPLLTFICIYIVFIQSFGDVFQQNRQLHSAILIWFF